MFKKIVVEDHASRVVHNALKRTWGDEYESYLSKVSASSIWTIIALVKNFATLHKVYRQAGISHATEYVRVVRLFYFYTVWKTWFAAHSVQAVFLARTNDQKRLALGAVAEEKDVHLVSFTVDRVALRTPAPFKIDTALCWTRRQADAMQEIKIPAVRMPVPVLQEMRLPVPELSNAKCGFLLNAKCNIEALKKWLESALREHDLHGLQIRPHPGYEAEKLKSMNDVEIADWRQPLDEYLNSLDLVFALNTNAIIDALLHGVPVVYVGGLDPYEYDLHRFVSEGIAYPYDSGKQLSDGVNRFYNSAGFRNKWNTAEFTSDGTEERDVLLKISRRKND